MDRNASWWAFLSITFILIKTNSDNTYPLDDTRRIFYESHLTHWGRVTHICVGKLIIIGSDNGLSPNRRQAIIWTNDGLLSIGPLRTYFSENLIKLQQFSLKKLHVKMASAKWRPSCLSLNVLIIWPYNINTTSSIDRVPLTKV